MDITLAKTFLTIMEVGNFRTASEKLNVTQSTVSARVKVLEDQLGKVLFIRNKSGATATKAGLAFQEYALSFVQLWEKARSKISSEELYRETLVIGARPVLWEPIIMKWLPWAKQKLPDVSYGVEIGVAFDLIRKLEDGIIDVAVLLSAPSIPGIAVEELYLEQFLLVTTPEIAREALPLEQMMETHYIDIDWGVEFNHNKKHYFPAPASAQLTVNLGLYGLKYMMDFGGCSYYPRSMVQDEINTGQIVIVEDAPKITQPAYMAYSKDGLSEYLKPLLSGLRNIASDLK